MSARIDFSSIDARAIVLAGRVKIFGCGFPFAGSAGSRGTACCANAVVAVRTKAMAALLKNFGAKLQILLDSFPMRHSPASGLSKIAPAF
jgi:hypothetical protein